MVKSIPLLVFPNLPSPQSFSNAVFKEKYWLNERSKKGVQQASLQCYHIKSNRYYAKIISFFTRASSFNR